MALQNWDPPHPSSAVPRAVDSQRGSIFRRSKDTSPKHLVEQTKTSVRDTPGISAGPQVRAGNPSLACQQQVHHCPAHLFPSPNQSPGCPAWEEVINYITSSMLLLSKGHCGTDRYQRVSRAIDFVYGFVR